VAVNARLTLCQLASIDLLKTETYTKGE
jgi:hypothetical protein